MGKILEIKDSSVMKEIPANDEINNLIQESLSGSSNFLDKAQGLAANVVQGPLELGSSVLGMLGAEGSGSQKVSEQLQSASDYLGERYPESKIDPSDKVGSLVKKTAKNIPLLFSPGSAAKTAINIGSDITGGAVSQKLKDSGFGMGAQIAGDVIGSIGTNMFLKSSSFENISKLFNRKGAISEPVKGEVEKFTSKLYDKEKDIGKKLLTDTSDISKDIKDTLKTVLKNEEIYSPALVNRLKKTTKELGKNKVTASKLFEEKKLFNKLFSEIDQFSGENKNVKEYVSKLFINKVEEVGSKFKEWGSVTKQADRLTELKHWEPSLVNFIADKTGIEVVKKYGKNKLTKLLLSSIGASYTGMSSYVGTGLVAADIITGNLLKGGAVMKELYSTSEGKKLLGDLALSAASKSKPKIGAAINRLDKYITKNESSFNVDNKRSNIINIPDNSVLKEVT